jgi:D-lactate dehydrogenase
MMDVKFFEVFQEEEEAIKRYLPRSLSAGFTDKTIQEEGEEGCPAPIICVRTQSRIPLEWAEQMKAILSRSQGYDHLVAYQRKVNRTLALGYLREYCSQAVAEHALMALLVLLKRTKKQVLAFRSFQRDYLTGMNVSGQKALIIGLGKIGYRLARMLKGLNLEVRGVDIEQRHAEVTYVPLDEGIAWAQIIFGCVPLTPDTHKMLRYDILRKVPPGAFFINIARGEIAPLKDLQRLIEENILGGLALDVYEQEGPLATRLRSSHSREDRDEGKDTIQNILSLSEKENVLFTPHNAFNTREALDTKARLTVQSIQQILQTGTFPFPVPVE